MITLYLFPFLGFLSCIFFGRKIGPGCKILPIFFLFMTFLSSLYVFTDCTSNLNYSLKVDWFGFVNSDLYIYIDLISSSMLILISFISLMVHIYSVSYMDGDPHQVRFMGYLSLFTFFMIILVTSNNLIQIFIGWEGVGLCSFLLISFWFTRSLAAKAALKAMVVNKIGDVGMLLGIFLLYSNMGSTMFSEIIPSYYNNEIITIFLLVGVVGKSAQIGLHMWLPDAMEGPTPVSALIHAATMVTAGVFIIIRLSPIFDQSPLTLVIIIIVGSLTSFFSACVALTQNDVKKVIAYSTCSQLGYMVTICGFSHYSSGLFHLLNHGFFKALLFLSAGSIIHSVNDQDIRKMGNLKECLPVSYICMLIGSISLMGLPFLTGFYSKDLLLELIYQEHFLSFTLWLGVLSAFLTSFYSFRLIYYSFYSYPNYYTKIHSEDIILLIPLIILSVLSCSIGYLLQNFILLDFLPPLLPLISKQLPLFVSIIGSSLSIIVGLYMYKIYNIYFFNYITYSFLIRLWYFDNIINYLNIITIKKAFWINYKLIDNQIIESFGPTYFYKKSTNLSSNISLIHTGEISLYIFIFIIWFVILSC